MNNESQYKLTVVRLETGELELVGNRAGLKDLADVCLGLSQLSDDEASTAANHYHIADFLNNAEEGSLELIIRYDPNL
jgi:hypothetical protein